MRAKAMSVRLCSDADFGAVFAVCNEGAIAYRGVIPADCWDEPYMPETELRREIKDGVRFFGGFDDGRLIGVMGLQDVGEVVLIRHAYVRTARQRTGVGSALPVHLLSLAQRPVLIGTWKAATWAIEFYRRHGFELVEDPLRETLLRRYWKISERQIEESVVLRAVGSR